MDEIRENQIEKIYHLLQDDLSKYIFENRLMFSLTKDTKFMKNVVYTIKEAREIYDYLKTIKSKIGIFGAGRAGRYLLETYSDIEFECFIDNNKIEDKCLKLPVVSLQEFKKKYSDGYIVISTKLYHREILQQLIEEGFDQKRIINVGIITEKLSQLQYFDLTAIEKKQKEIFVDGGSYDGVTSLRFSNWCSGNGYVYAWEPDPNNLIKCKTLFETNNINYKLIPKGLWSSNKKLKLKANEACSMITDNGDNEIEVDSIDRLIDKEVTFIKMDLEGSEYEALLGAEKMIKRSKPKLAICVYHKPEDIWKLPWLIYKFNPEYKFYMRHYSFSWSETVLYAL
ncbi:MAG: FkbM family methyltransferase [Lachnospiraceae bacterium]|nr:FkbM family methyltransferase [Lachnospiraceae bacterium]